MSLASEYAALQAAAEADLEAAKAAAPPSFEGPNGRAEVTDTGGLRLVPKLKTTFEIPAQGALVFAAWIQATFGE